jgi:hypothetical protein
MAEVVILAFEGKKPCFLHALLNALDMSDNGVDVSLILEGESPRLLKEVTLESDSLYPLYRKVKDRGLIKAVCYGCSKMMGALEIAQSEGLPINGEMSNHVPLSPYVERGAEIISF